MIETQDDLQEAVARIVLDEGDRLDLEAKTFSEFSSRAIGPSISALANSDYRRITGVDSTVARHDLQDLVRRGLALRIGERRATRYAITPRDVVDDGRERS